MDDRKRQYQQRNNMPQRAGNGRRSGTRQKGKGKLPLYFVVVCILLIANMILSLYLLIQIRSMRSTLNQAWQAEPLGQGQTVPDGLRAGTSGNGGVTDVSGSKDSAIGVFGNGDGITGSGSGKDQQASSGREQGGLPASGAAQGGQGLGSRNPQAPSVPDTKKADQDYVELCGLEEVQKPMKRTHQEVLRRLKELSRDNDIIGEIYDNADLYSERMLEALANNPEMADFVAGYLTAEKKAAGKFTDSEKEQEYPLFLQWDPRWGYAEYGDDGSIGLAGCGPTCLSMVMWYLLGYEELTPDFIADYSMNNGYYMWGVGTTWALLEDFPAMYGVDVRQPGISEEQMKRALDQGRVIICSMSEGEFTTGGHFIVIYGYDREGFKVNDSNCVARSRKSWSYDEIGDQIKQVWTFGLGDKKDDRDVVYSYHGRDGETDAL